jgi:5-methyltetrahydrofolate--homocysteine methyltransferase
MLWYTPAHIARYPELVKGCQAPKPARKPDCLWLSGLELLEVKPEKNFVNIGERSNLPAPVNSYVLLKRETTKRLLLLHVIV